MSIPTTLGALVQAEPALGRLLEQRVSMRTAYHLAKFAKLVRDETAVYHQQRDALIRELGAPREPTDAERATGIQGPVTEVTPANRTAFFARERELAAVPVTLEWTRLNLSTLDGIQVSGADLLALEPLLTDPPPEPTP
jgi:hypothetical protein